MSIFSRTRDIFAANFGDLLDRSDDPVKMIRLMILEMEETLVDVRASAARTIADRKELQRHCDKCRSLEGSWAEKAELAMSRGREDLARAALVERQKAVDMAEQLCGEIDVLGKSLRAAEEDIAKLQAKLREARTRQAQTLARLETAQTSIRVHEAHAGSRAQDALARFEQLERRADLAEGHADALRMGQPKTLEDEMFELETADKIEAQLAELRARAAKKGDE